MENIAQDDDLLLLKKYYLAETTESEDKIVQNRLQTDEDFREKAQLYQKLLWTVEDWENRYLQAHEAGKLKDATQDTSTTNTKSLRIFWAASSVVFLLVVVWWVSPTFSPKSTDNTIRMGKKDSTQQELKNIEKKGGRCVVMLDCIKKLEREQDEQARKLIVDALVPSFDTVQVLGTNGNQVGFYNKEKGNVWIGIDKIGDAHYTFANVEGRKLVLRLRP